MQLRDIYCELRLDGGKLATGQIVEVHFRPQTSYSRQTWVCLVLASYDDEKNQIHQTLVSRDYDELTIVKFE